MRIQHVAINVSSEELLNETVRFYEMLGGISLKRPAMLEADTPGQWLGFGDTQVHLLVGEPLPKGAHFALDLGDRFSEILATIEQSGFKLRAGRPLWGTKRCFAIDPSGNEVELFESTPPSIPL